MTDPLVDALWKKVLDHWDDDTAHGKFVTYCQEAGVLLEAAVRYRGMAGDHARGPTAQKRLQGIAALAMADLESKKSPPSRGSGDWARIVLIVFFLGASAVLWIAFGR